MITFFKHFIIPDADQEQGIIMGQKLNAYNNCYPLRIFPPKDITKFIFDQPITIFYGNNGSGKSTILNVIATKLNAQRKHQFLPTAYFDAYVNQCECDFNEYNPNLKEVKLITSDDIFDYILNVDYINTSVNKKREQLVEEYRLLKRKDCADFYNDFDKLKDKIDNNSKTMSHYIRDRLGSNNIIAQSNGQTSLLFWEKEIDENSIYILDEPENSLSPENILKLKKFIEDSARFYNCQFIISTHSPLLLNLEFSKIYDLDENPCRVKKWSELENVKVYYKFFIDNKDKFD